LKCIIQGNVEKRVPENVLEQNVEKRVWEIGIKEDAFILGNDVFIHVDS
jgi:hypothetical protein